MVYQLTGSFGLFYITEITELTDIFLKLVVEHEIVPGNTCVIILGF